MLDVFRSVAARRAVLLLVEDLHWIDASSLELLSVLIDQAATMPIGVLLTARPDPAPVGGAVAHNADHADAFSPPPHRANDLERRR